MSTPSSFTSTFFFSVKLGNLQQVGVESSTNSRPRIISEVRHTRLFISSGSGHIVSHATAGKANISSAIRSVSMKRGENRDS